MDEENFLNKRDLSKTLGVLEEKFVCDSFSSVLGKFVKKQKKKNEKSNWIISCLTLPTKVSLIRKFSCANAFLYLYIYNKEKIWSYTHKAYSA